MRDKFFTQKACDRCGGDLKVRIMSWFTDETICPECSDREREIKRKLVAQDKSDMEGCGFVPKV